MQELINTAESEFNALIFELNQDKEAMDFDRIRCAFYNAQQKMNAIEVEIQVEEAMQDATYDIPENENPSYMEMVAMQAKEEQQWRERFQQEQYSKLNPITTK